MPHRLLPDRQGDPVRAINLVAPLAAEATENPQSDDAGHAYRARSVEVSPLIDASLRWGDLYSANRHSTPSTATMLGTRTSTTATRTTGTRTTSSECVSSADRSADGCAECSFAELVQAYFDCRKRKRNTLAALAFECDLERNLVALYEELASGTYRPGISICFVITRPKPREVWAADFRDRIVHHLLYNRLAPRFYPSFITDSCACIPGRGTLYAARRLEHHVRSITQNWRRRASYLKLDIANCFVSIDKHFLFALLAMRIPERWWLKLTERVVFHDPRSHYISQSSPARLALIPPHKSLFRQSADKGLPIGNLSSQFFANVYLDVLDQHIKHRIGAQYYVRYVDDLILLHESPQWLNDARESIDVQLADRLALTLNPRKTILQPISRGIDFVGHEIRPWRRIIRRRTVNNSLHRLARLPSERVFAAANSYLGLLRQATHSIGDRQRFARIALKRGHTVNLKMTKVY